MQSKILKPAFSAKAMMYDANVDALTVTASGKPEEARERANTWLNMVYDRRLEENYADKWKDACLLGYQGYKAGSVFVGYRHDGAMLRVTGARSHQIWTDISDDARPSRIDLAVDIWYDRDVANQIKTLVQLIDDGRKIAARGKPVGLRYEDGRGDGDTIYIGSRSSWRFTRIYDKWRESGSDDYKFCIRFEIEYKDDMARAVNGELRAAEDTRRYIVSLVQAELARYGVGLDTGEEISPMERIAIRREPTDIERSVQWLQESVAPTVLRLMQEGLTRAQLESILFARADLWTESEGL